MVVLSDKKTNFLIDNQIAMQTTKKVLIVLCIIAACLYTLINPMYGVKFIIIALCAHYSAILAEIIFLTHQRPMDFTKAKAYTKETYPEISGLILALLLPVNTPLYVIVIALFFALFIVKMAFGGYTFNIFNIAIAARIFIQVSWPELINNMQVDGIVDYILNFIYKIDYSQANLLLFNNLDINQFTFNDTSIYSLIFSISLIVALGYLSLKKIINPLNTILTLVLILAMYTISLNLNFALSYISLPVVLIVSIFALNDPVTTATSLLAKLVSFSAFVAISSFMSITNNNQYGILFGVLVMNMLIPLIDAKFSDNKKLIAALIASLILVVGASFLIKAILNDNKAVVSTNTNLVITHEK
ncbi:MAG: RnfABCDGE type electron transport complex subunit D [Bacilli bacterium]